MGKAVQSVGAVARIFITAPFATILGRDAYFAVAGQATLLVQRCTAHLALVDIIHLADIRRVLFGVFGQYLVRPDVFFFDRITGSGIQIEFPE